MKPIKAVILAAGEGKRMKSSIPKVLHKVCGIEMVQRVLNVCPEGCEAIVVVGHGKEKVEPFVEKQAKVVEQKEQKGTGHAVQMAEPYLAGYRGKTLVLAGDMPVLKKQTLETLIAQTPEH
ncbi:MAG: NTP transferase domain-containing protein, partial [Acutalibacteraceae bacterium]